MRIAVAGGKGGCSKTTTAINLAIALNDLKKDVVLVDCNFTTPNIGLYLGVPFVSKTIHDVLSDGLNLNDAVYLHKSGVKLIPGNISIEKLKDVEPNLLNKKLNDLNNDFVIMDCAAGLGKESLIALESCDKILIVTNPEMPAATDALKTIKIGEELNKEIMGVVLAKRTGKDEMKVNAVEKLLERPIIAIINEDKKVKESLVKKDAVVNVFPYSDAAIGYKRLACYLSGEDFVDVKKEGLFKEFIRFVFGK
ncbi:MAG: cell division ATPase MinD [Nanoarchaeota archaeon]|nr:cell division ATPase MinD [Nanoarchaeota archaeon]